MLGGRINRLTLGEQRGHCSSTLGFGGGSSCWLPEVLAPHSCSPAEAEGDPKESHCDSFLHLGPKKSRAQDSEREKPETVATLSNLWGGAGLVELPVTTWLPTCTWPPGEEPAVLRAGGRCPDRSLLTSRPASSFQLPSFPLQMKPRKQKPYRY